MTTKKYITDTQPAKIINKRKIRMNTQTAQELILGYKHQIDSDEYDAIIETIMRRVRKCKYTLVVLNIELIDKFKDKLEKDGYLIEMITCRTIYSWFFNQKYYRISWFNKNEYTKFNTNEIESEYLWIYTDNNNKFNM